MLWKQEETGCTQKGYILSNFFSSTFAYFISLEAHIDSNIESNCTVHTKNKNNIYWNYLIANSKQENFLISLLFDFFGLIDFFLICIFFIN